ncbi:unnamed protein product [Acanthosepion pharaonis]|uniref:Uncharacterized protein n=1 Tax=Acanthosepion pharaonis TaxID=158019 RepID=A0A812D2J1_ACAPH|nr:unnamed protein product [Sepia pharaonis]
MAAIFSPSIFSPSVYFIFFLFTSFFFCFCSNKNHHRPLQPPLRLIRNPKPTNFSFFSSSFFSFPSFLLFSSFPGEGLFSSFFCFFVLHLQIKNSLSLIYSSSFFFSLYFFLFHPPFSSFFFFFFFNFFTVYSTPPPFISAFFLRLHFSSLISLLPFLFFI